MKKFTSVRSYIDNSNLGKHKTFIVENDIDRDKTEKYPFIDLFPDVMIDGKQYHTSKIRPKEQTYCEDMIEYEKGKLIGIEVMY